MICKGLISRKNIFNQFQFVSSKVEFSKLRDTTVYLCTSKNLNDHTLTDDFYYDHAQWLITFTTSQINRVTFPHHRSERECWRMMNVFTLN